MTSTVSTSLTDFSAALDKLDQSGSNFTKTPGLDLRKTHAERHCRYDVGEFMAMRYDLKSTSLRTEFDRVRMKYEELLNNCPPSLLRSPPMSRSLLLLRESPTTMMMTIKRVPISLTLRP